MSPDGVEGSRSGPAIRDRSVMGLRGGWSKEATASLPLRLSRPSVMMCRTTTKEFGHGGSD
jgi:hypothetical protein